MYVFLMLCWLWPAAAPHQPIALSKPPRRKRSNDPNLLQDLPQRPHCAQCEHEAAHPHAPPPTPPEPLPPSHRRPRTVDTSMHFCPHRGCRYRGWLGLGNRRANGHPSGGPWRQWHVRPATAISPSIMAPSFMASRLPWSCSSGCWRAWLRGWGFAPPPGSSKSIRIRCCTGWWRPRAAQGLYELLSVRGTRPKAATR